MVEIGLVGEIIREKRPLGRAHDVYFLFDIGTKPKGDQARNKLFIRLTAQQLEKLRRFRETVPKEAILGSAGLKIDTRNKKVTWRLLFPFEPSVNIPFDYKTMDAIRNARPYQHGIGALVFHAGTEYAAKKYRGYTVNHEYVRPAARAFLNRLGISHEKSYPIKQYRKIVKNYIEGKFGKGRKVHLL